MVKRELLFYFVISSLVVGLIDQLSKYLMLIFDPQLALGFLTIHLVKNTGAGFGILKGYSLILGLFSLIVAVVLVWNYKKIPKEKIVQVIFGVLLGGVVGNLIDRLFRGYVIDFIDLSFWPAFNVADAGISVAAVGLVWYYWGK